MIYLKMEIIRDNNNKREKEKKTVGLFTAAHIMMPKLNDEK